MACPDPEDLAQLASPAGGTVDRGAIADHAASCESCHAALVLLMAEGTQATPDLRGDRSAPGDAERIGRYEVRRKLGSGGMGVVYLAHDPELGRELAIKVLRRGSSAGRLRREAQALARLSHPNVVTVHDVGEHGGQMFVAMALVDGVNLREWLATPRETSAILDALRQAARGIIAAHEAGLIHRDLKPDNIFVATDGKVLVGDFGLARDIDDGPIAPASASGEVAALDLTATGSVLGTPAYMALEQAKGRADERSDQFSFCVTAWEALSGGRPFRGLTLDDLSAAMVRGEIAPLPRERGVSPKVERALRRGLKAQPGDRFPTMAALLRELEPPRRRWPLAVAGVVALGAAVTATAIVTRSEPAPDPAEQCASTATMIDPTWSAARRSAVESELRARGVTAEAVTELTRRLDAYAKTWTSVRRATCVATVTQQLAPAQAAARVACLDQASAILGDTAADLATKGRGDAAGSWKRVRSLASPVSCTSDDVALLLPAKPEHQAILRDLARATNGEELHALEQRAEATTDVAARLEVALAVANDALEDRRLGEAESLLARARPLAEQLGAPSARVRAFALSAQSLCIQGNHPEATQFLDIAIAAAQRMKEVEHELADDELAAARDECMYRRGEYTELLPHLQTRLATLQQRYGAGSLDEAVLRARLGQVYSQLDKRTEAVRETEAANLIWRKYLPPGKDAAVAETQLSVAAYQAQDLEAALLHSERSVQLFLVLENDPDLLIALVDLGMLYEIAADPKAAIATYTTALERFPDVPELEQRSQHRAGALDGRGAMKLRVGDNASAVTDFQEAIATAERIGAKDLVLEAKVGLGRAWVAVGEHARGARQLRDALASYHGTRIGPAQFSLAQALWVTGDRAGAIAAAKLAETEMGKRVAQLATSPFAKRLIPVNQAILADIERWRDTHK